MNNQRMFAAASLILSGAFLAVGMSFFSPYWLQNCPATEPNRSNFLLNSTQWEGFGYSRGLWAMCGVRCQWFWESGYLLQVNLLTPLKWHLATQVLYFIASAMVLICEVAARVQLCGRTRHTVYRAIGVTLLVSFILQIASMAVFGGGAWNAYSTLSKPLENFYWMGTSSVYFHWSYWMTIPGVILTLTAGILFLIIDGCGRNEKF